MMQLRFQRIWHFVALLVLEFINMWCYNDLSVIVIITNIMWSFLQCFFFRTVNLIEDACFSQILYHHTQFLITHWIALELIPSQKLVCSPHWYCYWQGVKIYENWWCPMAWHTNFWKISHLVWDMRFFLAERVQIVVFWVVILCSVVGGYQCFGKTLTLGGSRFHQNTGNHLQFNTT
jgi:hypothetical protein